MRTVYTNKLKDAFRSVGVQLPAVTINMIDDHFDREVNKMAQRCKEGNVRRLTPELFWVALGRINARNS